MTFSAAAMLRATMLLLGAAAAPAAAQTPPAAAPIIAPQSASPDAEALAAQMRVLASDPENLTALLAAGELATRLGDTAGANAFFIRADHIAPHDPRLAAGQALLAVRQEHPGDALRLFDRAADGGVAMAPYLADRGLAYDLTGDQPRAQRDYRDALKAGTNDETTRRLALSLGIAGKRDAALDLLDPLLRRGDRGAWRVRAFVLAMTGDVAGASEIAATMLPPGMAGGMQRFFQLLPQMGPVDRAFAVHFGELHATPERLADARLAPVLPPLPPEPSIARPPVQVATARPVVPSRAGHHRRDPPAVTTPTPVTPPAAARQPLPTPPRETFGEETPAPPVQVARNDAPRPAPSRVAAPEPSPVVAARPASSVPAAVALPAPARTDAEQPARRAGTGMPERPADGASSATPPAVTPTAAPAPSTTPAAPTAPATTVASQTPVPPPSAPVRSDASLLATIVAGIDSTPPAPATAAKPAVPSTVDKPKPAAPAIARAKPAVADDCLPTKAVKTRAGHRRATAAGSTPCKVADAEAADSAPAKTGDKLADCAPAPSGKGVAMGRRAKALPAKRSTACPAADGDKAKASNDAGDSSAAADDCAPPAKVRARKGTRPAVATGRHAKATNCPADDKAKAKDDTDGDAAADDCPPPAKAHGRKGARPTATRGKKGTNCSVDSGGKKGAAAREPARIWVQVAGGAFEGDLAKAWAAAKAKAPAAFKGREGWTTPLRATNRVLTGPFKTREDAQAFVNSLTKSGMSAFVFESEAGQKVDKLGAK